MLELFHYSEDELKKIFDNRKAQFSLLDSALSMSYLTVVRETSSWNIDKPFIQSLKVRDSENPITVRNSDLRI